MITTVVIDRIVQDVLVFAATAAAAAATFAQT